MSLSWAHFQANWKDWKDKTFKKLLCSLDPQKSLLFSKKYIFNNVNLVIQHYEVYKSIGKHLWINAWKKSSTAAENRMGLIH